VSVLAVLITGTLVSCARQRRRIDRVAQNAEMQQNYDLRGRRIHQAASRQSEQPRRAPGPRARQAARVAGSLHHGPPSPATGKLEEALVEYQLAAELNPGNADIERELQDTRTQLRAKIAIREDGKTRLESLIAQSLARRCRAPTCRRRQAARLGDLPRRHAPRRLRRDRQVHESQRRCSIRRSAISRVDRSARPDARRALNALSPRRATSGASPSQRAITIVPDTAAKRREYEEEIVRTFYLSNADLKETIDMLRIVVDARRISAITATNAITIKDTPERITAAGKIITAIDKARPEVIIDVELLEVNRTHLHEYGLQIASPAHRG
jgi:general secretion pathway protein D